MNSLFTVKICRLFVSIPRVLVSMDPSYHLAGLHTVHWKQIKYPLHYRLKRNFYEGN